jgi:hypothetical protein
MAKKIIVNVDVNTKNSEKNVGQLSKEFEKTATSIDKVSNSTKNLANDAKKAGEAFVSPTTQLRNLEDRMAAIGNVGSKEFQRLAKEAGKLKDQINNAKAASRALSSDFPRLQLGAEMFRTIGGAAQVAMGATALLGEENKELTKSIQKMMAVQSIMNGLNAIAASLSDETLLGIKARIALQKAQAVATKVQIGVQKALNVVMRANPIGLIVAAVAALIAGIVALVMNIKKVIKFFGDWKNAVLALLGPIGWAIMAYRKLQDVRDENFKKNIDNAAKIATSTKAQIELIKKLREEEQKLFDEQQRGYNSQIKRLEALGENTDELRKEQIRSQIQNLKDRQKEDKQILELAKGQIKGEIDKNGRIFSALQSRIKDSESALRDFNNQIRDKESELIAIDRKANEERVNNWKKANDERLKAEEEFIKRSTEGWEKADEIRLEMEEDSLDKRLEIRQREFDQATKNLDDNIQGEKELRLAEEEKLAQDLAKIKKEWFNRGEQAVKMERKKVQNEIIAESSVTEEKIQKTRFQIWMEYQGQMVEKWQTDNAKLIEDIQKSFELASQFITGVMDVANQIMTEQAEQRAAQRESAYAKETEELKAQLANREIDQKQYENKLALLDQKKTMEERAEARKAFQMDKAMRISQAIMGTAQAVISGLSAPFPLGIIQAAINGAMGAAQIGVISAQKFRAARGGVVPGTSTGTDTVPAMLDGGEAVINANSASMFPNVLSAINQMGGGESLIPEVSTQSTGTQPTFSENSGGMVKAYVVESEMTDKQKKVSRIERAASF